VPTKADLYVYDIENYPNCFAITLKRPGDDEIIQTWVHETEGVGGTPLGEVLDLFDNPTRYFAGYNSFHFDDQVMAFLLEHRGRLEKLIDPAWADALERRAFCEEVNEFAGRIIHGRRDKREEYKYKYHDRFLPLDLMRTNRLFKGLKQVAINLRWPKIQDLPIPPGTEVRASELKTLLDYNINDVLMTEALYEESRPEIQLRANVGRMFKVHLINEDRSGMANKLLEKFYAEETGLSPRTFKQFRTSRESIRISECIAKKVSFETPHLQEFLARIKDVVVTLPGKFETQVQVGRTIYDIKLGGIHSRRPSEIFESTDAETIEDCDVTSYYPMTILNLKIAPAHLGALFLSLYKRIVDRRVHVKDQRKAHAKGSREYKVLDLEQEALKIVVNSAFGKYGDEKYWLYDPLAMYRVTLSGQMFLLMLIERLESVGIEVVYANTDGITARVPKALKSEYDRICSEWSEETGFDLEYQTYRRFIVRDVNNYVAQTTSGDVKMKGSFDTKRWKDLSKAFLHPVVPKAVCDYFLCGTPVKDTIRSHDDPLDFAMSQNLGSDFKPYALRVDGEGHHIERLQKTNRYVITTRGVALYKENGSGRKTSLAPRPVTIINDYDSANPPTPDYRWYEEQALSEVLRFGRQEQGSLFE
jgi:hypothetical protein